MSAWTRDTPLQQGSLIDVREFPELGEEVGEDFPFAVVVSHDCDLAREDLEAEPYVEIIPAFSVASPDGNLSGCRNPRRLQLVYENEPGDPLCLEMRAPDRRVVEKKVMASVRPCPEWRLPGHGLEILQRWLAQRYRRAALPDSLNERLEGLRELLKRRGKNHANRIIGFWLSWDPVTEQPDQEVYELDVRVVYSIEQQNAGNEAEALVEEIDRWHEEHGEPQRILMNECEAVSEEEFTLADMRRHVQLNFDYLSFRREPAGPTAE